MKKRAGKTTKISVSLDNRDAEYLRARAKRVHNGNVSAVVAEGIRRIQEEEGRRALGRWIDAHVPPATEEELNAIRAEWRGKKKRKKAA